MFAFVTILHGSIMALPLAPWHFRCCFLRALRAAAAETTEAVTGTVLTDPRMAVFGGRPGMPLSLGSVYAMITAKFLRGDFPRRVMRVVDTDNGVLQGARSISVTRDGTHLLVVAGNCVLVLRFADGAVVRTIGPAEGGPGELEFRVPMAICSAPDGVHYVADMGNARVQCLTPEFDFGGIPFRRIGIIFGVKATAEELAVCVSPFTLVFDYASITVHVICRATGAALRRVLVLEDPMFSSIARLRSSRQLDYIGRAANNEFISSTSLGTIVLIDAEAGIVCDSIAAPDMGPVTVHGSTVYAISRTAPQCVYVFG